jgi:hypothetical protein
MDGRRFDVVAQMVGRRGLFRSTLALVGFGFLPTRAAAATACDLQQKGESCQRGTECCSGRCNRDKTRCRCSALRKPCFENSDCCGDITGLAGSIVCSDKNGFSEIVCCVSESGKCGSSADCCSEFRCRHNKCRA